jgi:hypothetical protein
MSGGFKAIALALLCALAPISSASAALPAGFFGMDAGAITTYNATDLDKALAVMAANNIKTIRLDTQWGTIEPKKGTWTWSKWDPLVLAMAKRGITLAPTADYSISWAQPFPYNTGTLKNQFIPPEDKDAFAQYAAAIAKRYGPGGAFWKAHPEVTARPIKTVEIWNEENHSSYWQTKPQPGAYATLYNKSRAAIRAANPYVLTLVGGLAANDGGSSSSDAIEPTQFLASMGPVAIDGVAVHCYGGSVSGIINYVKGVRSWMNAHGYASKPLSLNEFGFFPESGLSDTARADRYRQTATQLKNLQATLNLLTISPYSWEGNPHTLDLGHISTLNVFGGAYAGVAKSSVGT